MRLRFLVSLVAVLLVAVGSIVAALLVLSSEESHADQLQRDAALRAAEQAETVALLSVGELASAAAFLQAETDLNRHEFEVIGTSLLRRGALTATAFAPRVAHSGRAAFERRHSFPIIERGGIGRPRIARRRAEYFPVTYAVAEQQGRAPFGYDLASDPARGPFLRRAGVTGRPTATPVTTLIFGGPGINVYRPVFRDGAPLSTPTERRRALIGYAAGAFRVSDLAAAALGALPDSADVQIKADGETVIGEAVSPEDPARAQISIADRTWLLIVSEGGGADIALPLAIGTIGVALAALLGALVLVWSRNERMRELQLQASQDSLTGLKNRRRFQEDLRTEMARCNRTGAQGALLMLDLDNFKQVNDTLGHPVGDRVIEEIAMILGGRTRETDVLARVGGDEFAIVLPDCDAEEAQRVAETIVSAIREHVPRPEGVPKITASLGIAVFGPGTEAGFESVQRDADAAMYAAKEAGRDGVRVAD
jgi:diguanylate cyclase (GGDEF)-like protein